jgi:hypothetical protein
MGTETGTLLPDVKETLLLNEVPICNCTWQDIPAGASVIVKEAVCVVPWVKFPDWYW